MSVQRGRGASPWMREKLRPVHCKRCDRLFYLCRFCDRGQRYCSDPCREASRRESLQRARQTYAKSQKGKQNNRERQRRWRGRGLWALLRLKKAVTDPSSQAETVVVCLNREGAGMGEARGDGQAVAVAEERGVSATARTDRVNLDGTVPGKRLGEAVACCHACGRPGVVIRQWRRRGRFRWSPF